MALTEYEKVKTLLIAQTLSPTKGVIDKWALIAVTAVDKHLGSFANHLVTLYTRKPSFNKKYGYDTLKNPVQVYGHAFRTIEEWLAIHATVSRDLASYVDSVIASTKPAWQIMAERNGWTAPR